MLDSLLLKKLKFIRFDKDIIMYRVDVMNICVCSLWTLTRILSCVKDNIPKEIISLIDDYAIKAWLHDYKIKKSIFRRWEKNTTFHPKPFTKLKGEIYCDGGEMLRYHGFDYFTRRPHTKGIVCVILFQEITCVFTKHNIVYPFVIDRRKNDYALQQPIHNISSPYETWMSFYNGNEITKKYNDIYDDDPYLPSQTIPFKRLCPCIWGGHDDFDNKISRHSSGYELAHRVSYFPEIDRYYTEEQRLTWTLV